MHRTLYRSIVNPGFRTRITGWKAALAIESVIVTATTLPVLKQGGNAADVA